MSKVLVIEDNEDNLRLVTYALKRAGYEVVSAASGESGIEKAIAERPGIILMDINLPGIDGIETTRRIRRSGANGNTTIIAVTSYAMIGDRDRILAAGCNGYIEKPIDPLSLIDQIRAIMDRSEDEDPHS